MADEQIVATPNLIAKVARRKAFAQRHDYLAMKMLRGEPDADGTPITPEKLTALAAEIRKQFPYEAEG